MSAPTRSTAAVLNAARRRRLTRIWRRAMFSAACSSASESRLLAVRKSLLGGGQRGLTVVLPVQRLGQAYARVQLAVRAAHLVPSVGGGGEVAEVRWPSTSSSSQPRRRGQARASDSWASSTTLVVAGDQAGADQPLDEIALIPRPSASAAAAGTYRLTVGCSVRPAQQQVTQLRPLLGGNRLVQPFGGLRHGAADAAGGAVAGDGQRAAFAPLPGLAEGV